MSIKDAYALALSLRARVRVLPPAVVVVGVGVVVCHMPFGSALSCPESLNRCPIRLEVIDEGENVSKYSVSSTVEPALYKKLFKQIFSEQKANSAFRGFR